MEMRKREVKEEDPLPRRRSVLGNGADGLLPASILPRTWKFIIIAVVLIISFLKLAEVLGIFYFVLMPSHQATVDNSSQYDTTAPHEQGESPQETVERLKDHLCQRTGNTSCKLCPLYWIPHQDKCYNFSDTKEAWNFSDKACFSSKAQLLLIDSPQKKEFIDGHLKKTNGYFWVGLTKEKGKWTWTSGTPLNSGYAVKDDSNGHTCAIAGKNEFSAESCSNPNKWICEKDAVPITDSQKKRMHGL